MYADHELGVFVAQLLVFAAAVKVGLSVPYLPVVNKDFSRHRNLEEYIKLCDNVDTLIKTAYHKNEN